MLNGASKAPMFPSSPKSPESVAAEIPGSIRSVLGTKGFPVIPMGNLSSRLGID